MNLPNWESYQERLASFNKTNWPSESPVYIKELVEAGFVYTGENDLVFCFRCGVIANDWKDVDEPLKRHKYLNSKCSFLINHSVSSAASSPMQLKSLDDYEKEIFVYDWQPGIGVVQRTFMTQPVQCTSSSVNITDVIEYQESQSLLQKRHSDFKMSNNMHLEQAHNTLVSPNYKLYTVESRVQRNGNMSYEDNRFQSFVIFPIEKHWPSPEVLAASGFYCVNEKGKVKCFSCGVEITNWETSSQDPMIRHRSLSPSCTFVRSSERFGNANIRHLEERTSNMVLPASERAHKRNCSLENEMTSQQMYHPQVSVTGTQNLPQILRHSTQSFYDPQEHFLLRSNSHQYLQNRSGPRPRVSRYHASLPDLDQSDFYKRLQTFLTWPKNAPVQPSELAQAGFFYTGEGDGVRCYKCGVSLKAWEKEDTPWQEHMKYSRACPLVIEKKREISGIVLNASTQLRLSPTLQQQNRILPQRMEYRPEPQPVQDTRSISPYSTSEQSFEDLHVPDYDGALRQHSGPPYPSSSRYYRTAYHDFCHPSRPDFTSQYENVYTRSQSNPENSGIVDAIRSDFSGFSSPILNGVTSETNFSKTPSRSSLTLTSNTTDICHALPVKCSSGRTFPSPSSRTFAPSESVNTPPQCLKSKLFGKSEENNNPCGGITQQDIDKLLDMGFSDDLVHATITCYLNHSPRTFNSAQHLAQAVIYFQKHGRLEGSPFGKDLTSTTEDGKQIVPEKTEKPIFDSSSDGILCKICMDNNVEITFHPCGHLIVCQSCALGMKQCPICRLEITDTLRTYLC